MAEKGLLETEALYGSPEGDAVLTTLGDLVGDRVVHGVPVRKVRSFAGQRHYSGLFWSVTTGGHVGYESLLELDRLWLADFDPHVEWLASQPLWLSGLDGSAQRRHVPDLLLKRYDGSFILVDVKPEEFASLPDVAEVFAWTARLADAKGWRYEVWSGASATLLANVRWLAVGRRVDLVDAAALDVVTRVGLSGMTIAEICVASSARVAGLLVKPAVMSMLWSGAWVTDLQVPLSGESVVTWAEDTA